MKKDLVSIVVPVFNRANIIDKTLASALDQTYENIEIVVSDNKSDDGTWEIIQRYARNNRKIKAFQNYENLGPVRNWRMALEKSNGEYVKILWSDDLIASDFVEKCVNIIKSDSEIGFVFTNVKIFDEHNDTIEKTAFFPNTGIFPSRLFIERSTLTRELPNSPGCALFRRKDVLRNLLLDLPNHANSDFSQHAIGNDLLIFLLTAKDYEKFAFISEHLSQFRSHSGSITSSTKSAYLIGNYLLAKAYFIENFIDDDELKKKFNAILKFYLPRIVKTKLNINKISDFYFKSNMFQIDYFYYFIHKIQNKYKKFVSKYKLKN